MVEQWGNRGTGPTGASGCAGHGGGMWVVEMELGRRGLHLLTIVGSWE